MTVDLPKIERKLLDWVIDWNEGEFTGEINSDTDLFATGVLDSMGFTGLIAHLEDETGIVFDFTNTESGDAVTIRNLLNYCFPMAQAQR